MIHLGNDEAYYFTYALQPDWNHFDHPPLVGIFIRIFTLNLHWVNDFSMRLAAIVSAAVCTWVIFKCGKLIKNERTGWIAAILYNTSIYTSIISGLFILPDSPQLVFWLLAMYSMLKLILTVHTPRQGNIRLVLIGLYIGLAVMCKIHGVFLWFGFGVYVLLRDRKYLKNPFLYLSILLTLLIISPIFFWNLSNHFITWRFQGQRVEIHQAAIHIGSFVTTTLGQLFYSNPINVFIYLLALVGLNKIDFPGKLLNLLNWLIYPIILATTVISLFRTTLPHWSGPGFIGLMLISGYVLDEYKMHGKQKFCDLWLKISYLFIIIIVIAGVLMIKFYPGTMGDRKLPEGGKGDLTLDMYGWNELQSQFEIIRQKDIKTGLMQSTSPIIVAKWFPACHYLFYVAYPMHMRIVGVGNVFDLHKFAWLNKMEGEIEKGANAYFISSSNYYKNPEIIYNNDFKKITLIDKIPQRRLGKIARYWYIYRLDVALRKLGDVLPQ
jgi:4-amino-4-deoxy-L-arabinose transferase-like glycosyltransferase